MHWIGRTMLLGVGYMAITAIGPLYDNQMPLIYQRYTSNLFLVGIFMSLDNVLALTIQPYFGALSDQTRTRLGRRIPYLLIGYPAAAVFLAMIPFVAASGLGLVLAVTILLNLALSGTRSPTLALLPDLIPSAQRSQANGIINLMGGIGAVIATVGGGLLIKMGGLSLPFLALTGLLVLATVMFLIWVREPAGATGQVQESPRSLVDAAVRLVRVADTRVWTLAGAVLFWTLGIQAGNTWFSTYAVKHLGMESGSTLLVQGAVAGTFLIAAVPVGFLSGRIGRRRAMVAGAVLAALAMGSLTFATGLTHLLIALAVTGLGWALFIVNAYPAMVELAPAGETGAYTGIYYIASQVGAIVAPPAFGTIVRSLGWPAMWVGLLVVFGVAALIVARARGIEPQGAAPRAAA